MSIFYIQVCELVVLGYFGGGLTLELGCLEGAVTENLRHTREVPTNISMD